MVARRSGPCCTLWPKFKVIQGQCVRERVLLPRDTVTPLPGVCGGPLECPQNEGGSAGPICLRVRPKPAAPLCLTLSLSCWQSCRETVKKTRASLSHGITHSTLCTWLTSRRWEPHSLRGEGRDPDGGPPASEEQRVGVGRVLQGTPSGRCTYNMAPGLWSTAPPAGRKF